MALPEAITAIEGQLSNVLERPDVRVEGQRPSQAVFRSGTRVNIHGEFVYYVTVEIHVPKTHDYVLESQITTVVNIAEGLLSWLASEDRIGDMLVWWVQPPSAEYDWVEMAYGSVTIPLCERYPRDAF